MNARPELAFDGWGINGPDEYRTRLATFTRCHVQPENQGGTGLAERYGPIMAEAPAMLQALRDLFEHCAMVHNKWGENSNMREANAAQARARAILARLEGAP